MGTRYPTARLSRGLASYITMASQLSGPNIEEEYYWSTTLDKDNKEYTWAVQEDGNDDSEDEESDPPCKPNHRLLIKNALLDPEATKDEVTVLEIETKGYKEQKVIAPFLAMKGGAELQRYVDLLLPDSAKIRIKRGNGPVTLVGSHCVDFYDYRNMGYAGEDDDDEEESEEDEDEDMKLRLPRPPLRKKRKSNSCPRRVPPRRPKRRVPPRRPRRRVLKRRLPRKARLRRRKPRSRRLASQPPLKKARRGRPAASSLLPPGTARRRGRDAVINSSYNCILLNCLLRYLFAACQGTRMQESRPKSNF